MLRFWRTNRRDYYGKKRHRTETLILLVQDGGPSWVADVFGRFVERLQCLLHGHTEWVEMDNRSICCVWCHDYLRDVEKAV